jgi:hypothetical protein
MDLHPCCECYSIVPPRTSKQLVLICAFLCASASLREMPWGEGVPALASLCGFASEFIPSAGKAGVPRDASQPLTLIYFRFASATRRTISVAMSTCSSVYRSQNVDQRTNVSRKSRAVGQVFSLYS